MGSCFSKKNVCASSPPPAALPDPPEKLKSEALPGKKEETPVVKKEIFIIKHRMSHEVDRQRTEEEKSEIKKVEEFVDKGKNVSSGNCLDGGGGGAPVRTSSCTKEEVDAILIQCGRLSRSSSTGKAALSSESGGRKYSGSKRSYDFDRENGKCDDTNADGDDEAVARERDNRRRERHRQSQGRRRTPSRERDQAAQQRSGSRERSGSGGGRRVSRSPNRRSESPIPTNSGANSSSSAANGNARPGKMVSVPATVASTNAEANTAAAGVKRIQVKRNVGGDAAALGTRSAASPRARSPARLRATNENQTQNQQQPLSLSRSNSRKAEHSPFRRNPLGEIDTNIISQTAATPLQKSNTDNKTAENNNRMNISNNLTNASCKNQELHVGLNVISAVPENPKITAATRSRSSRLSRDLDISPEALSNPNSSYTALLLEDIQNFHQKSTAPPPPTAFSLPPCVTKACSILEAVADLNSSTGSNLSTTELRRTATEQMSKTYDNKSALSAANPTRKGKQEIRDPIMESEIVGSDDLMQPSFHKYVTVRRGGVDEDLEEQESSGSNSFVGSQQQWASSSCWEPNSAESTDRWTSSSSRSLSRQNEVSPVGYQRHTASEEGGKKHSATAKKREGDNQQSGIGRGRTANANRVSELASAAVAVSSR